MFNQQRVESRLLEQASTDLIPRRFLSGREERADEKYPWVSKDVTFIKQYKNLSPIFYSDLLAIIRQT